MQAYGKNQIQVQVTAVSPVDIMGAARTIPACQSQRCPLRLQVYTCLYRSIAA